ncbi:phage tail tape measure protein [Paenibacillus sp. GYB004]|uniref:phage tail tape measure protein n=1 Tax=Paenibacillus sp. GYB004 TaxID=2994393 RepID=UPI002F967A43
MAKKVYESTFQFGGQLSPTFKKATKQVEQGADGVSEALQQVQKDGKAASGVFGKLSKATGDFGNALYKVAQYTGAFALISGVSDSLSSIAGSVGAFQSSMKQVQASTGMTAAEMSEIQSMSRSLYNQNLGEDFDDLASAISTARQVTQLQGDALEATTKHAIVYRDVFGEDMKESIKAVDTMVKNFGITSNEAYNLLAQGAQRGLDKSGELLDTANEYTPYFSKLGFSANEMFDIFSAGLDAGAFNLDKVGDGIKEFGIRTKDGSKASMEAYQTIGLSGEQMTAQFAAGGEEAQKAFMATVKAIDELNDPVQKNAVSVQLFGTQAEDLEARVIQSLGSARKQFDMTKNTMEEITSIKYDTIGMAFRGIGRQLLTTFIMPLGDKALPYLQQFGNWFNKSIPSIKTFFGKVGSEISGFTEKLWTSAGPVLSSIKDRFISTLQPLLPHVKSIFGSIGKIVQQIAPVFQKVGASLFQAGAAIAKAIMPIGLYMANKLYPIVSKVFGFLANDVAPIISRSFSVVLPVVTSVFGKLGEAITAVFNIAKPVIDGLVGAFNFAFPAIQYIVTSAIQSVTGVFKGLMTSLGGVLDFITGVFTGNWSKAWQGIKDVFAGVFAGLRAIVATPLNAVIKLVNSAISGINKIKVDIPDWIPGIGGKSFGLNIPQIPELQAFAKGGIATRPSIFGEAGPEIAIPLNNAPRSHALLDTANRIMGDSSGGGDIIVYYEPQNYFSGPTDRGQVEAAQQRNNNDLERRLKAIARNQRRVEMR